MYFIGTSARLVVPIRDRIVEYHPTTGQVIRTRRALGVEFTPAGGAVPDYAKDAVSRLAGFGRGIGLNEDPFDRVGHLDTDQEAVRQNWDAEEKRTVEEALCRVVGQSFIRADAPPAELPWANYDEIEGDDDVASERIVDTLRATGASAKAVRRYEYENKNRPGVLSVLDLLVAEEDKDIEGLIPA